MTSSFSLPAINNRALFPLVLFAGYLLVAMIGLHTYVPFFSVNWILGLLALAMIPPVRQPARFAQRWLWVATAFAILYILIPAKTLLFGAVVSAILFVVESFYGTTRFAWTWTLIVMSPIFEYLTNVFSFPLRLSLTSLAARLMEFTNPGVRAEGNLLVGDGVEFSVDPACMGLHMFIASLLAGMIWIGMFEKKIGKRISMYAAFALMFCICMLNLLSNLFRILSLVYFNIGPDAAMHQGMGLVCFAVYVLLPSGMLTRYWTRHYGKNIPDIGRLPVRAPGARWARHGVLLAIIACVVFLNKDLTGKEVNSIAVSQVPGYRCTPLADHILKLENSHVLIYIKPIAGFYSSDHQPTNCWTGSGYEFKKVEEKKIDGQLVYAAVLEKSGDRLYTGWWYDDGGRTTISQLDWRWHALTDGKSYSLVNVTASTAADLEKEIRKFVIIKRSTKCLTRL